MGGVRVSVEGEGRGCCRELGEQSKQEDQYWLRRSDRLNGQRTGWLLWTRTLKTISRNGLRERDKWKVLDWIIEEVDDPFPTLVLVLLGDRLETDLISRGRPTPKLDGLT
ncbi:unnamed protein product [Boreogadus saida]